jgi:tetratricopeptide (TPR) repeat protein
VSLKLARYEDALRYLDAALSRDANPELTFLRSLVLYHSGMPEEGLAEIELALAKRPKSWMYHFYRAMMLIEAGRADDALVVLKGPARPFKCPSSWFLIGLAFTIKGESGKAADACSRALPIVKIGRKYGPMPWEQMMEAWLLIQMGRLAEASGAATWTETKNPGDHEALVMQAEIHRRRGDARQALRCLEQAAARSPFSVVALIKDPAFGGLVGIPGFAGLLERATRDWQARLSAIRHRSGIAQSGA